MGIEVACLHCGKTFSAEPNRLALGKDKFCSRECYRAHPRQVESFADRFWRKVQKTDGCWLWTGSLDVKGYGRIQAGRRGGTPLLAHRCAYELMWGPIMPGLHVCHRCDNPPCVRPDHLFLGDQAANMADCSAKGRTTRGERGTGAKLTAEDVGAIRARYAAGDVSQSRLAAEYGVKQMTVSDIVRGVTWQHLDGLA